MTNFEKAKEIFTLEFFDKNGGFCTAINKIRNRKVCNDINCNECYKWLAEEYKPQILDDAEREYLSAVIKPFRDKIKYICKLNTVTSGEYIFFVGKLPMYNFKLPCFINDSMYKNMELNKKYTLEELGL